MKPMNRRKFIQTSSLAALAGSVTSFTPVKTKFPNGISENFPEFSEAQRKWLELKFGMFIHFGLNTFEGKEWGEGNTPLSVFNPTDLNTDQWCEVAAEAGMKYMVLVSKHHDGFCNWHTKQTGYSIKNTPFKKDLLAMLRKSADKYGLKLGVYYSLWDRHEPLHDKDEHAYVEFMKRQLHELLTNYGEMVELWFDGFWKKQQSGWKDETGAWIGQESFMQAWRNEGAFRWEMDHLYQYVKSLQPNCIVMNNPTTRFRATPLFPVDALPSEKGQYMESYRSDWSWLGKKVSLPMQVETTMSVKGEEEFSQGSWFWHDWDHSVVEASEVAGWLKRFESMNTNLLLNCGPMNTGLLRPEDTGVLKEIGKLKS